MHEKEFAIGWAQYATEVVLEPGEGWHDHHAARERLLDGRREPT